MPMPMLRFRRILVGTSGAESDDAVQVALSMARALATELIVLGVVPPMSPETQAEGVGLDEALEAPKRLSVQLQSIAATAKQYGVAVQTRLAKGDPEKTIEQEAEAQAVDLIVVGRRDVSRVRRWLEGSTSEALVRHSPISVLVVHSQ